MLCCRSAVDVGRDLPFNVASFIPPFHKYCLLLLCRLNYFYSATLKAAPFALLCLQHCRRIIICCFLPLSSLCRELYGHTTQIQQFFDSPISILGTTTPFSRAFDCFLFVKHDCHIILNCVLSFLSSACVEEF